MVKTKRLTCDSARDHLTIERPLSPKHKLLNKWCFWFLKGDRSRDWSDCLEKVVTVETVEDFWGVYLQVVPASDLSFGSDFYLFKEGIKPMWEDPKNVRGGRWFVVVDKQQRGTRLDELWLELMMAVTGEQFMNLGQYICGAAVNLRQKGDKIALWTSEATLDDANRRIGMIFKSKLGLEENLRYEVHKDASARTGSQIKPKFIISKKKKNSSTLPLAITNAGDDTKVKA